MKPRVSMVLLLLFLCQQQAIDEFLGKMKLSLDDMKNRPSLAAAVVGYTGEQSNTFTGVCKIRCAHINVHRPFLCRAMPCCAMLCCLSARSAPACEGPCV